MLNGSLSEHGLGCLATKRAKPLAKDRRANNVKRHEPAKRYAILIRQGPARFEVLKQPECIRLVTSKESLHRLSKGLRPPIVEFPAHATGAFGVLALATVTHSDLLTAGRGPCEAPYKPCGHRMVLSPRVGTHLAL
jgi:hypothetical protein